MMTNGQWAISIVLLIQVDFKSALVWLFIVAVAVAVVVVSLVLVSGLRKTTCVLFGASVSLVGFRFRH